MFRTFQFEDEMYATLDCVPLAVRRKLDLAGLKISLAGWQALPFGERLALCHLPIDGAGDRAMYAHVLHAFCDTHGVALTPLEVPASPPWQTQTVPPVVDDACKPLGLASTAWEELDEDERYSLYKMSTPEPRVEKLREIIKELGFFPRSIRP